MDYKRLAHAFGDAPTLDAVPDVVDIANTMPLSPPPDLQLRVTGASGEEVYRQAAAFVTLVARFGIVGPALDFGSGWGRICRFLLAHVPPASLYALDVDPAMTALTQATLPGVQSLTVTESPPTVLRDSTAATVTAFSVFTHLSPSAHESWARELGRLTRPEGTAHLTVLDADSIKTGVFADSEAAWERYAHGEFVYTATGGGGVLDPEFYGWAAAPREYIEVTWAKAGFKIANWVPSSGVLGHQAMVSFRKR